MADEGVGMSVTDCTSFALMAALGLSEVFTFDDDLSQVGFIRWP
jgi:predicted nucleic acid-binding protein